jgi:hypothetical protein
MRGVRNETRRKFTLEQCARIEAMSLARAALRAGLTVDDGRLWVGVASSSDEAKRRARMIVSLALVPSNVGGHRWWFSCPVCDRQVQALYVQPTSRQLACRNCHNLTYRSAQRHDKRVDFMRRHPELIERLLSVRRLPLRAMLLAYRAAVAPPIHAHTR